MMTSNGVGYLELQPKAPFRLDLTVWAMRRRAHNAVDRFDGTWYRRVLDVRDGAVEVAVRQIGNIDAPTLAVELQSGATALSDPVLAACRQILELTLGLNTDLAGFYRMAELDVQLRELALRFRGMRPPRFASVFEAIVNAIVCQQLSLMVGVHLLNRLSKRYGSTVWEDPGGAAYGAPTAAQVATAEVSELREFGLSQAKAGALIAAARAIVENRFDLAALAQAGDDDARGQLTALPGIGRWSAEYVLLRGLGRHHVLPGDDVGASNSLQRRFGLTTRPNYDRIQQLSQSWRPYGGLVYFHLLLAGLEASGQVFGNDSPTHRPE